LIYIFPLKEQTGELTQKALWCSHFFNGFMNEKTIPVVWTNDDIRFGQSAELRRQLEFLDRHGIPGVFFVIPRRRGEPYRDLDEDKELLTLIEKARGRGHEFYQHGFIHTAFECGVPELGMLEHSPLEKRRFDEERGDVEMRHTLEAQLEMLEAGRRIWRRAFGEDSVGFRPGWGAFCNNFYKALTILGFEWVSSRLPCFTSWDWNRGVWDTPICFREALPTKPYFHPQGIREYPIAGDYGFRVPNDPKRIDAMAGLGMQEFEVYFERRDPMLIVSHPHGLQFPGAVNELPAHPQGTGYAVHEKLIPTLINDGRANFMGMKELAARYGNTPTPPVVS